MGARGPAGFILLALLLVLTVSLPGAGAASVQEGRDEVLPGCGICYPGGYDINTVGDVEGTIIDVQAPAQGPVRFVVAGERERWVVLAAPVWFWKSMGPRVAPGDFVTVRGSKTLGADGTLYLVAREIRSSGEETAVVFRDRCGTPLWSGSHRRSENPLREGADCGSQGPSGGRR